MRTVTLYTRQGCHLCEDAHAVLDRAHRRVAFTLRVVDIDTDAALRSRYDHHVPVIAIDGHHLFGGSVDEDALVARLRA
jgi:glutaredoxin